MQYQVGLSRSRVIIVLGVIAVFLIVGLLLWQAGNHSTTPSAASTTTPAVDPNITSIADGPYTGWNTFNDSLEKFTFRYPTDWELTQTTGTDRKGAQREYVQLDGPNNFVLSYEILKPDGSYGSDCNGCSFVQATPLDGTGAAKQLYIVVNSQTINQQPYQTLSLSDHTQLSQQASSAYPFYMALRNQGYIVRWKGGYHVAGPDGSETLFASYDTFKVSPEVATATLLLQSIRYQ